MDELLRSIDACCKNDDSEDVAYERIRYKIAGITSMSHDAFDVKETFKEIARTAYEAAWNSRPEYTCHMVPMVYVDKNFRPTDTKTGTFLCSECGYENKEKMNYCVSCGAKVVEE